MGSHRLPDGNTVGGKGQLTNVVIDSFQNYYGNALQNNPKCLITMKHAVWAIYYHSISSENESQDEQHKFCPTGIDSWCRYQCSFVNGESYESCCPLQFVFRNELKKIFTDLSDESLLNRCLQGLSQNQNEALNGIVVEMS